MFVSPKDLTRLKYETFDRRWCRKGQRQPKTTHSTRHGHVLARLNRGERRRCRKFCRAHLGNLPAEVSEALEGTPPMGVYHAKGWRRRRRNRRRRSQP